MKYSRIDPIIAEWCADHKLMLLFGLPPDSRRFFYVSGTPYAESYQISVGIAESGEIIVDAWDVETDDDEELHEQFITTEAALRTTLDQAFQRLQAWKVRPRVPRIEGGSFAGGPSVGTKASGSIWQRCLDFFLTRRRRPR